MSANVVFLAPTWPVWKALLPIVRAVVAEENTAVLWVSDGADQQAHVDMSAKFALAKTDYVLSESLGRRCGVGKLLFAVLLDERGG